MDSSIRASINSWQTCLCDLFPSSIAISRPQLRYWLARSRPPRMLQSLGAYRIRDRGSAREAQSMFKGAWPLVENTVVDCSHLSLDVTILHSFPEVCFEVLVFFVSMWFYHGVRCEYLLAASCHNQLAAYSVRITRKDTPQSLMRTTHHNHFHRRAQIPQ